jgi:hypothetical protein
MAGSTPLEQWRRAVRWPVCLDRIWRSLEQRHGKSAGTREMIDHAGARGFGGRMGSADRGRGRGVAFGDHRRGGRTAHPTDGLHAFCRVHKKGLRPPIALPPYSPKQSPTIWLAIPPNRSDGCDDRNPVQENSMKLPQHAQGVQALVFYPSSSMAGSGLAGQTSDRTAEGHPARRLRCRLRA